MAALRFLLLMVLLLTTCIARAGDDDEDDNVPSVQQQASGLPGESSVITLSGPQQASTGLVLARLEGIEWRNEVTASGKVLDIQDLLSLRTRYRTAQAEAAVARAALALARKNRQRVTTLHREDIIAGRVLAEVESQYASEQARSLAAERLLADLRSQSVQTVGSELSRLILSDHAPLLEDWIRQRRVLLLISLPERQVTSTPIATLHISRDTDRKTARPAQLLSSAPLTDHFTQGETYYYHASAEGLRSGMRLHVWIPQTGTAQPGVIVPYTAVIWHEGKPWVYRQIAPDRYARSELPEHREYGADWLVTGSLKPGDTVVVNGAQLLLSEELKRQIPDEDDD